MTTTKPSAVRIEAVRAALRAKYGVRGHRITGDGAVHVYSTMPNSIETGWWLMGDLVSAECHLGIDMPEMDHGSAADYWAK
jgi:hypothetical protein